MAEYDIIIRNAYSNEHDRTLAIGIADGTIATLEKEIDAGADTEIDAEENLVGPGFVDSHMHIDKSFAACGERRPKGNESSFDFAEIMAREEEYFADASVEEITQRALQNIEMAVAAGTTYIRSHVTVNHETFGLQNMEAVTAARDEASHLADIQLVPAARHVPDEAGKRILSDAIELGKHSGSINEPVLVGGSDPAGSNKNIEGTIEAWFDIASEHDVGLDVHIQDGGTLGGYTLERLLEYTEKNGYDGRVTASHCFCLSHLPEWQIDGLIDEFNARETSVVSCYQSTRPSMPVRELLESGVTLAHGTDNDRDFVFPHGNADSLEGALVESTKLHGDRTFVDDYRWFDTNEGLGWLWSMITEQGATALDIEKQYGLKEGNPANLVVFDEPSPQWAIISQATRRYVIKDGTVVARDGELLPEHKVTE
ncbi:amidohydrolase family protein [Natronococcus sp. A-GB7]|uniref:amidohydrolase family protein n=1 Tax=Natronococcus sp. A-GB7 TaxID=3037649 RepID=UPI00241E3452|nr:amidohydrolase family protein [Natronococcus sp. A-GB7]MDG5820748.1 amidohydrolase family protein [Natronococcus sp. A-GB7]